MSFLAVETWIAAVGLLILMLDVFSGIAKKNLTVIAATAAAIGLIAAPFTAPCPLAGWIVPYYQVDGVSFFFKYLVLAVTLMTLLMQLDYLPVLRQYMFVKSPDAGLGEMAALPLIVSSGLMWMVSARDFTTLFVALELSTIGFYVLIAAMRRNAGSLEAGVKYLILGALSTGFLVYGIAWLFGLTGSFDFEVIQQRVAQGGCGQSALIFTFALLMAGLTFKLAAAPFQFWAPDVYQGAPTPVSAFLAVASKAAAVIVLARILPAFLSHPDLGGDFATILGVMAAATMLLGSLAAIPQRNIKRLMGYSSISNAGFLLWAISSTGWTGAGFSGVAIAGVYMAGYALAALLCFHILTVVRRETGAEDLNAFVGLARQNPLLAGAMTIGMASLAGLPLTVGFVGKFLVFGAGISRADYVVTVCALIAAVVGFYYYFKVIKAMFWEQAPATAPGDLYQHISRLTKGVVIALAASIVLLGVYPRPILGPLAAKPAAESTVR